MLPNSQETAVIGANLGRENEIHNKTRALGRGEVTQAMLKDHDL